MCMCVYTYLEASVRFWNIDFFRGIYIILTLVVQEMHDINTNTKLKQLWSIQYGGRECDLRGCILCIHLFSIKRGG